MHLVNWTPFRDMEGVFDCYQDMLARSALAGSERAFGREFEWRPNVDISESKKEYLIKAELPDIDKDDVDVSVENGLLTIRESVISKVTRKLRHSIASKECTENFPVDLRCRVTSMSRKFRRSQRTVC